MPPVGLPARNERLPGHSQPQPAPASSAEADDSGAEESIDNYMSRLMQRLRPSSGESAAPTYTAPRAQPARATQDASASAAGVPPQPKPLPTTAAAEARKPLEMSPRRVAPEKRIDLSALREVANFSAHNALSRHSRQILINTMHSKLAMAIVALAAGVGLFWMWNQFGAVEMTFYSAAAAVMVAIWFGVQYALLTGRLRVNEAGHVNINWAAFHLSRSVAAAAAKDAVAKDAAADSAGDSAKAASEPDASAGSAHDAAST